MSEQKRARLFVLLAALSLVVLAGCGGGGSTAAASPAGTATDSAASGVPTEMQPYAACLKQHGVDLPAGGRFQGGGEGAGQGGQGGQDGQGRVPPASFQLGQSQTSTGSSNGSSNASPPASFDRSAFQAARQACADLLPEGATAFGGPGFGGGGASTGAGGASSSAFNAYRSCMSDHGVTLPARGQGQSASSSVAPPVSIDRNSAAFKAANDVCSALLPTPQQGAPTQGTTP